MLILPVAIASVESVLFTMKIVKKKKSLKINLMVTTHKNAFFKFIGYTFLFFGEIQKKDKVVQTQTQTTLEMINT